MTWDYFPFLAEDTNQQEILARPEGLAGGFVDEVSVRFFQGEKESARRRYMRGAGGDITLPDLVSQTVPDFSSLPSSRWLAFQVDFELLTPWYSRDDRLFHLLDNPVRKDRVFGVPFMAASSWKGMLRWACRMQAGLREHLERHNGKLDSWRDPDWILHLFGNVKGEGEEFSQGALVFYPTWFNKIGFEVINPHSRERRAGTQPIYYEVVPPGAKGRLSLLYAPWPGMKPKAKAEEVLPKLLAAIEALLTTYGISAKRTAGWGTAEITKWRAFHKIGGYVEKDDCAALWREVQNWLSRRGTS
ncbi:RAMP superfamily CRISPR-associated protein [Thermus thermophilus]|uniref:RAMP superfamily CRISPR-associated protein n=1 Tax=Thermus thermophilus TaxID=274 RepID=UPI0003D7A5D8|nr:RAMP superfamily CRISPR-associated protein [Thermus thermophilus]